MEFSFDLSLTNQSVPGIGGGVAPITYLLRDDFTDTAAAPIGATRDATPGPGTMNITDTAGTRVSVGSGTLSIVGNGGWNQAGFWYTPVITRDSGVVARVKIASGAGSGAGMMMFTTNGNANFSGYNNVGIRTNQAGAFNARRTTDGTSPQISVPSRLIGSWYVVLRGAGRYILHDPDDGNDVVLLWWDDWDSTASLYMGATHFSTGYQLDFADLAVPDAAYFNIGSLAIASDSFGRADGSLGNTDGAGHAEASGGSGVTWTAQAGTWGVSSNKAQASALASGVAVATVPSSTEDVLIECDLVRSAGEVGVVARWEDSNNYLRAYHDGTNCVLQEVVAGTPTTRITAAATYAANASIKLHLRGQRSMLYYNDLYISTSGTLTSSVSGTDHGLYTTDTGNTHDNLIVFGSNGYNAIRDNFPT